MSIRSELHDAYLTGDEPKITIHRFGHPPTTKGRWWQRGDVVKLKNKSKILITSSHPLLTWVPFNFRTRLTYFFQETKTLFRHIMFKQPVAQTTGFKTTISTGYPGIAIYGETLPPPNAPVSQSDREVAS